MNGASRLRGIYAIVNEGRADFERYAASILAGGVRIVQYRAKSGIVASNLRALRALTRAHDALLLLNDDWQTALDADCDGVHLGPEDATRMQMPMIRERLLGRWLGLSCGTAQEAHLAQEAGADYIGVGAVFATGSKTDAGDPIGVAGLQRVAAATRLPVAAIGGISLANIEQVRRCGVAMAAVISALDVPDAKAAAQRLVGAWAAP